MIVEQKSKISGEVKVPGDRSISHRALLVGGLAQGVTEIDGAALNEDTLVTIQCLRQLGIGVEILNNDKIKVYGRGLNGLLEPKGPINIVNSGTTFRSLTGILAGQKFNSVITAEERSYRRSMKRVVEFLKDMGADITSKTPEYYAPLNINASDLVGQNVKIKGSGGRLKSALVFASLFAEGQTKISEEIVSADHTEQLLNYFGADIKITPKSVICNKTSELYAKPIFVPGDISYATYFLLGAILIPDSEVVVKDVSLNPTRMNIINVLKRMNANIKTQNERVLNNERVGDIKAVYTPDLKSVDVTVEELEGFIDEIPTLMVAMTKANGTSTIKVSENVLEKKNNRVSHMSMELAKLGAKVIQLNDGVEIIGGNKLKGTIVETYNDERIAMPIGIAGMLATGETMIKKVQCVDVAFPTYFDILCNM